MYNNMNYNNFRNNGVNYNNYGDERFIGGFAVPFLLGGLGGAAVVGLSRPRPVFVQQPYYNYGPYPYGYGYGYNYGYRPY